MKKTIIASLIGAAFTTPIYAADAVNFNDIIVTASRTPQTREAPVADVSVIDAEEIQRAGQSTLVEILARQPGIEVTSSGGAGTISSIFMRGTNSGHVVILIDGLRIDSATLGSVALENLPVAQIQSIEILRCLLYTSPSPPLGPPIGSYFSRRNVATPLPPSPA